jgi:hypothetical protein
MEFARRIWSLAVLLSGCALCGCESGGHFSLFNYTTQPPFDQSICSVYVPIAQNVSFRKDLEFDLTRQVIEELGKRSGAPRVTSDPARADSELQLKIVNVKKSTVLLNQFGEARDAELLVQVEVVWRDLRPGHIGNILSNPKNYDPEVLPLPGEARPPAPMAIPLLVSPTSMFIPELGGSFASSERQAMTKAARQIVNMMEVWR